MNGLIVALALIFPVGDEGAKGTLSVSVKEIKYIVEEGVAGIGVRANLTEGGINADMDKVSSRLCEQLVPQVVPKLVANDQFETPEFFEVFTTVKRRNGYLEFRTGRKQRFTLADGKCLPEQKRDSPYVDNL